MSRDIKLVLLDELNCFFTGLTRKEIQYVRDKTKVFDQQSRHTAAYELGHHDGYAHFFDEDGLFFQWMIPKVIDILDAYGTPLEDVEFVDQREGNDIDFSSVEYVNEFYLMEETGFTLRDHQMKAINAVIEHRKGIISHATSAGKTVTTLGISKAFDGILPILVIVPSEHLAKQTEAQYAGSSLNYLRLHSGITGKKREQAFSQYDHIIITNKLLLNCLKFIEDKPFGLLIDEVHAYFGENFSNALRLELNNAPLRIGMTGTMPKDKLKRENILCHIGNDEIDTLKANELIKKKQAAPLDIYMKTIENPEVDSLSNASREWDWDTELRYYTTNKYLAEAVADYIKSLPPKNTLVLSHASTGKMIADHFDGEMIVDDTPTEERERRIGRFESQDDAIVFGSWGTSATGISQNRIYRVILVCAGKNSSVIQSLGRGIRLDGTADKRLEAIDISCNTKYAVRHRKERKKIYKEEQYPFHDVDESIIIDQEI